MHVKSIFKVRNSSSLYSGGGGLDCQTAQ